MNRPLHTTKGQGNGGRKTRRGSCVTLCREVSTLRHSTQVTIQDSLSQHIISSVKMCVKC